MATQGIELMERLKDTHGDESVLDFKIIPLGLLCSEGPLHVPLDKVFTLGQTQPLSLKFSPAPGSTVNVRADGCFKITVSLMIGEVPVVYPSILHEKCELSVEATMIVYDYNWDDEYAGGSPEVKLIQSRELSDGRHTDSLLAKFSCFDIAQW